MQIDGRTVVFDAIVDTGDSRYWFSTSPLFAAILPSVAAMCGVRQEAAACVSRLGYRIK